MLARWARDIEGHYECPMDIEWARDGREMAGLFIVQARPLEDRAIAARCR